MYPITISITLKLKDLNNKSNKNHSINTTAGTKNLLSLAHLILHV